jgi:hypothetical protein
MTHKDLQNLVCFAVFRKEPTLDELNDRAKLLALAGRGLLLGVALCGSIILWGNV